MHLQLWVRYAIAFCIDIHWDTLTNLESKISPFSSINKARTKFRMQLLMSLFLLFQTHGEISVMEREMTELYEAAGLFEVNVPEFKQLKACRREVGGELLARSAITAMCSY